LNGVEIYTIGIGDTNATGEDRVDFDVLGTIAARTGGQFFNATDETALEQVYRRIDELSAAEVRVQSWRPRTPLVHWPAGAATIVVLLGYAALLFSSRRRHRHA
jgi:Ca-activated chloride channel family protein